VKQPRRSPLRNFKSSNRRPLGHCLARSSVIRSTSGSALFVWSVNDVPWIVGLAGATAGLIRIDRPVGQRLTDDPPGTGYAVSRRVGKFSSAAANLGVAGGFYLFGRWRGEERPTTTGLLGLKALANSAIIVHSLKAFTQRPRPGNGAGYPNHNSDGEFFNGGNSSPSGHSAGAWALAIVVAHQYRHHRWVPLTAYGLAGFVAASRVPARKHFVSDIVVGSGLGFLIGRYVVNTRQQRWKLIPQPTSGGGAVNLVCEFWRTFWVALSTILRRPCGRKQS